MKGAQIGGTEVGNNWVGYVIDHSPAPMMLVQPTADMAKRNSRQRIAPLIEESDRLRDKVKDPKSRDSGNTVLMKEFPGGLLIMTGANSGPGLRSLPARFLFLDEVDGYPHDVDGEGDPVALAEARSRTFSRRKIFLCSTPTISGRSRIEAEFERTDQRYYYVPCPRCGEMQSLKWKQIKWEKGEPLGAWYECEVCNDRIENWEKTKMLEAGEWRGHAKTEDPKTVGFHISSLYSPVGWLDWGECAQEWVKTKDSQERLRGFINTILGETWKEQGEAPDWKRLYERRLPYKIGTLPEKVLFLTCGADVQKDRIELEIVGWGRNKISYSIDYRVFMGDTSSISGEPWQKFAETIHESFRTANGIDIPIRMTAVDSGYNTQTVYSWVRQFSVTKVIAVKGSDTQGTPVGIPRAVDVTVRGKKFRKGLKAFTIGVNILKSELYGWLRLNSPDVGQPEPPGFCHFPEYGEDYFKMLTAEQMVLKKLRGFSKAEWQKVRDRNEALDARIYARAAATVCGMDRYKDDHWTTLESDLGIKIDKENKENFQNFPNNVKKGTIRRRKASYL